MNLSNTIFFIILLFIPINGFIFDWLFEGTIVSKAKKRDYDSVNNFLKKGVDVDFTDSDGNTALMYSARNGDINLVQLLLEHNANVKHSNKFGDTALMNCALGTYNPNRRSLGNYNSIGFENINPKGTFVKIAQLLISKSPEIINDKNNDGLNALKIAELSGNKEMVEFLSTTNFRI